jgi:hypothetical protein
VKPRAATIRIIWLITLLLVVIGGAAVTRRALHLFASSTARASLPEAALDAGFAQHPALTMTHIIPGLLFIALAPLQFVRTLRACRAVLHRWTRRVVIVSGMIIGCLASKPLEFWRILCESCPSSQLQLG